MSKKKATKKQNKGAKIKKCTMTKEDLALFHQLIKEHDKYYTEYSNNTNCAK